MPRKVKTAFTATDEDRAITGIHDVAFIPRIATASAGFEMRIGGGTSIMPRVAPTLYEFVEADNGDYLKVAEAVFRIFNRQDWLRENRARARIKVLRRQVSASTSCATRSTRSSRATGSTSATSTRRRCSSCTTRRPTPPRRRPARQPERRHSRVRPLRRLQRARAAPGRASPRSRSRSRAATSRPSSSAASPQIMRDFTGGYARTTVQQNLVLRWVRDESVYDVWQRLARARTSATPAPTRSPTSSPAPAPTAASSASPARWASTRPCRSASRRWRSTIR